MAKRSPMERFDSFVDRSPENGGCWLWTGGRNRGGYGKFKVNGRTVVAHRWIYEQHHGPISSGLQIDHVKARGCRFRHCVNTEHMEPVTARENLLRGDTFQARNAAKTECPQGHSYEGDNLMESPPGTRSCRICKRAAKARWRTANLDNVRRLDREAKARRRAG